MTKTAAAFLSFKNFFISLLSVPCPILRTMENPSEEDGKYPCKQSKPYEQEYAHEQYPETSVMYRKIHYQTDDRGYGHRNGYVAYGKQYRIPDKLPVGLLISCEHRKHIYHSRNVKNHKQPQHRCLPELPAKSIKIMLRRIPPHSLSAILKVTLYIAVSDVPAVNTGIVVITKQIFSNIRSNSLVSITVTGLSGLKKLFMVKLYNNLRYDRIFL